MKGLNVLFEDVKKKHRDLRKAERLAQKRRERRRQRKRFLDNPYKFAGEVLAEKRSGQLAASKAELEDHLRRVYSDPGRGAEMEDVGGLVRPTKPEVKFDTSELKWSEVTAFVRKARAGSAEGPNGLSYKLFKRCPGVLKILWRILKVLWRRSIVPEEWAKAEGVYIPKEQGSTEIDQFRPISLLNVDGKVFFGVLAKRLTHFVMSNGFIDVSVQKAGIPGFPGCLEHVQMIWSTICDVKRQKGNLDVVWLDLANAYGSVPHKLIRFAMEFFWVPTKVVDIVDAYYGKFEMRFMTRHYTTGC